MDSDPGRSHLGPDEPIEPPPASLARFRSARRLSSRKRRAETGLFLVEGPQAVREALRSPGLVQEIFVSTSGWQSGVLAAVGLVPVVTEDPRQPPVRQLAEDTFAQLTETVTPQGIVAVCRRLDLTLSELSTARPVPRLLVCCAEIRDPGNAGTIIRSADAAGADGVLLGAGSVDPYNPKAVRASTGSLFHLPIVTDVTLPAALAELRARGMQVLAADGAADSGLDDLAAAGELSQPTVWLFGNEARGLDHDQLRLADRSVAVPIYGRAESLNLSTAAAVCLYASAFAQRGDLR